LTGYSYNLKSIDKKVIKECEKELYIPEEIGANDGIDEENNFPIPNTPPAAAPAKPVITRKAGIVAAIVMLLVFGVYFFFESKSSDSPRWSMDDIAPQDYQGPAPEELKAIEDTKIKVDEEKAATPADKAPIEEESTDSQKEEKNPTIAEAPPDASNEPKKALSKQPETAPFLERKILIYFKHNSNELPDASYQVLDRLADFMLHSTSARVSIKGYSDSTGDYSYNVSVSRFRANTVKTYLAGKGVNPAYIRVDGLGPENPLASNDTAEGRQKNRRVEIDLSVDE
jgi:outer membrane protein OmpA-like peptidoglycan-associated protein